MSGPGSERDERLARLADAAHDRLAAGEEPDPETLATEFDVDPDDARRAVATVAAVADALADGLPDPDAGLPPPALPDDYEILGELGRGGMGVVYRARQRSLGRTVAVKVVRPASIGFADAVRRFRREAKSLARLRHPGIVAVHDAGVAGDAVWYSMDLVEGGSLADRLAKGRLHPLQAVRILTQVAAAVVHSHERGIVHRDLKPANILLDLESRAFVADFGLARDVALSLDGSGSSRLIGTPGYMAPEQAEGDAEAVGERTDVYALGVILYECLTGRAPFAGRPLHATIDAVIHEPPVPPRRRNRQIPKDLEAICLTAMAKRPARRYATARAFLEDLDAFARGRPVRARRPGAVATAARVLVRHRSTLGAALAAAAIVGFAVFWILLPRLGRSPETLAALAEEMAARGETGAAAALYAEAAERYGREGPIVESPRGPIQDELAWRIETGLADARTALARERLLAGEVAAAADELRSVADRTDGLFGDTGWPGRMTLDWNLAVARGMLDVGPEPGPAARRLWSHREDPPDALVRPDLLADDPVRRRAAARLLIGLDPTSGGPEGFFRRHASGEPARFVEPAADLVEFILKPDVQVYWGEAFGILLPVAEVGCAGDLADALVARAGREDTPAEVRATLAGLVAWLGDLPGGSRWPPEAPDRIFALWEKVRELPYPRALALEIEAAVGDVSGPRSGYTVDSEWLDSHIRFRGAFANWKEWWAAREGTPPSEWLPEGLRVSRPVSLDALLKRIDAARDRRERSRLHTLLRLVAPSGVRAPFYPTGQLEPVRPLAEAWREALGLSGARALPPAEAPPRLVRVAEFRLEDAGEPEILWEEFRELGLEEAWEIDHREGVVPTLWFDFWPPGLGGPTARAPRLPLGFRSNVRLHLVDGHLFLERGGIRTSRGGIASWGGSGESMPVGFVLPFDALESYSGSLRGGHAVNDFALAVALPADAEARPWTLEDWRALVAGNLEHLATVVEGARPARIPGRLDVDPRWFQALVWAPPVAAKLRVPGAGPALARIDAADVLHRGGVIDRVDVARLLAGDPGPLAEEKTRADLLRVFTHDAMGATWPIVRMLLTTEEPAIRAFALDAIRERELPPPVAARIEAAIEDGRLDAPDWLMARVDGAGTEAFLDRYEDAWPPAIGAALAALIALLSLGFALWPGRRPATRLPAAAGLVFAGVTFAALNPRVHGIDVLPDAIGFALAATGAWFFRTAVSRRTWRFVFGGFAVAFAARLAMGAESLLWIPGTVAGLATAAALVGVPCLARSLDSRRRNQRFLLFHLFFTLPVALVWGFGLVGALSGRTSASIRLDDAVAGLLILAFCVALLSALLKLGVSARRRARSARG